MMKPRDARPAVPAVLMILVAAWLAGCGGGGGGGSGAGVESTANSALTCAPGEFTVAAGPNPRELAFDWTICDQEAVDHYRMAVNVDGASGYTVLAGAGSVAASGYTHAVPVHLTDWVNALYRVVAVDGSGNEFASDDLGLLGTVSAEDVIGYFKASNAEGGDRFGFSLSLDGDTLAVGAYQENSAAVGVDGDAGDNSASAAGAVYVFTRDGDDAWSQEAYMKAGNTGGDDEFGSSVAVSGDTLAVAAIAEDSAATGIDRDGTDNSASGSGAVYVFTRDDGDAWHQRAYVKAGNTGSSDQLGVSVSLSGEMLAVGADQEDGSATGIGGDVTADDAPDAGAVYLY